MSRFSSALRSFFFVLTFRLPPDTSVKMTTSCPLSLSSRRTLSLVTSPLRSSCSSSEISAAASPPPAADGANVLQNFQLTMEAQALIQKGEYEKAFAQVRGPNPSPTPRC